MSSPAPISDRSKGKRLTALISAVVVMAMPGAAFVAVPLYRRICQLTGFDGTVRRAEAAPTQVLDRSVVVRFDANVRGVPWTFTADQTSQTVKFGKTGLAFIRVKNHGDKPVTALAAYNVVPESAASNFQKLQCFCFTDQTLQPGQSADFPVAYFVDPKYVTDPDTKNEPDITLSNTFFPVAGSAPAANSASNAPVKASSALGGTAKAAL